MLWNNLNAWYMMWTFIQVNEASSIYWYLNFSIMLAFVSLVFRWTCVFFVHNNKIIYLWTNQETPHKILENDKNFQSLCYFLYLYRPKTESMPTSWHVMLRRGKKKTSQGWRKSPRMLSLMEVSFRGIHLDSKGGHLRTSRTNQS